MEATTEAATIEEAEEQHAGQSLGEIIAEAIRAADEKAGTAQNGAASATLAEYMRPKEIEPYCVPERTPAGLALDWWKSTPEEIAEINKGNREAVNAFYERNLFQIKCLAYAFFRKNNWFKRVLSTEDLINQAYLDLATGMLILRPWNRAISKAFYKCFCYTAVGGLDEVFISYRKLQAKGGV